MRKLNLEGWQPLKITLTDELVDLHLQPTLDLQPASLHLTVIKMELSLLKYSDMQASLKATTSSRSLSHSKDTFREYSHVDFDLSCHELVEMLDLLNTR